VRQGQKEPALVPLGDAEPVRKAVASWRTEVQKEAGRADSKKLAQAAAALRRLVWEPLTRHLGECKTVLVAPAGALCQFPLAALPGAKGEGSFLLEEYAIGYVVSAHQLAALTRKPDKARAEPKGLLAVGDVAYGEGPAFGALLGTGPEA